MHPIEEKVQDLYDVLDEENYPPGTAGYALLSVLRNIEYEGRGLLTPMLAPVWCEDDVKEVSPSPDVDAKEVFALVNKWHDAEVGINWEVLKFHTETLA